MLFFIFIFQKKLISFWLDRGPFCGATDCPYFGLRVTLHSCLRNLTFTSGATPAFSTNSFILIAFFPHEPLIVFPLMDIYNGITLGLDEDAAGGLTKKIPWCK